MKPAALSLMWHILALMPTPHLQESLKALLTGHGKARPQHSQTQSPSALSRFLAHPRPHPPCTPGGSESPAPGQAQTGPQTQAPPGSGPGHP